MRCFRDLGGHGVGDAKAAALARGARDLDLRAMRGADRLHDRQAEPGATLLARARPVDSEESLEHMWKRFRGNPHAVVGDLEHRASLLTGYPQANRSAAGRVLDCVIEQVDDHLLEPGAVSLDHDARRNLP